MITQRMIVKALPIFLAACVLGIPAFAGLRLPDPASGYSGTSFYQGTRLDYAVYDMTISADSLKFNNAPGQGRYVYAYQLFNVSNSSAIGFLSLHGIEEGAIESSSDIGSVKDDPGISPTDEYPSNLKKTVVTYEFGNTSISVNKFSWILTIRSDGKPKAGTFTFDRPSSNEIPVSEASVTPEVPEPATMSLLLLGAVSMLRKRKR